MRYLYCGLSDYMFKQYFLLNSVFYNFIINNSLLNSCRQIVITLYKSTTGRMFENTENRTRGVRKFNVSLPCQENIQREDTFSAPKEGEIAYPQNNNLEISNQERVGVLQSPSRYVNDFTMILITAFTLIVQCVVSVSGTDKQNI